MAIATTIMMQLGAFQFGIDTAAYQELTRATEWRWPAQERFGQGAALQFVGPGAETITLPGVVYPQWRGGTGQVDAMRALAARGEPQLLVDGRGRTMGKWAIERIEERASVFAQAGVARRQEFTITLRRFPDAAADGAAAAALLGSATAVAAASSPISTAAAVAQAAAKAADAQVATLGGSLAQLAAAAGVIGAQASSAIGAAARGVDIARQLRGTASGVLADVRRFQTLASAAGGGRTLLDRASELLTRATTASRVLGNVERQAGGVQTQAGQIVRAAQRNSESLSGLLRSTRAQALALLERLG